MIYKSTAVTRPYIIFHFFVWLIYSSRHVGAMARYVDDAFRFSLISIFSMNGSTGRATKEYALRKTIILL